MYYLKNIIVVLLLLFSGVGYSHSQILPAFPGAEGFGAHTPGGRGGRIIRVTTLNDSGAGSLRAALDEVPLYPNEPRIIIFDVCGVIEGKYSDRMYVRYPFTTIAGQTAPGDGICLKGSALIVSAHDVIVRGMRVRPGDNNGWTPPPGTQNYDGPDGITISTQLQLGDIYNVIIDHCSVSWGVDENTSTWGTRNKPDKIYDVTFQWNIISEALNCAGIHIENGDIQCHSMGMLIGNLSSNVSIHHNLFAHNNGRNPRVQADTKAPVEIINNTIFNWRNLCTEPGQQADIINNFYKPGINYKHHTNPDPSKKSYWEIVGSDFANSLYIKGNIGPNRPNDSISDWAMVYGDTAKMKSSTKLLTNEVLPIIIQPTLAAHEDVLKYAGALAPQRDATDKRVVNSVNNITGIVIDKLFQIGGYPVYKSDCTAPLDTDGDGIPDWFEDEFGLDKLIKDGNDTNLSKQFTGVEGYTNMEVYMNYLIDIHISGSINSLDKTPAIKPCMAFNDQSRKLLTIEGISIIESIDIISIQGLKVISKKTSGQIANIDTQNLVPGVYIMIIRLDTGNHYIQKLIL